MASEVNSFFPNIVQLIYPSFFFFLFLLRVTPSPDNAKFNNPPPIPRFSLPLFPFPSFYDYFNPTPPSSWLFPNMGVFDDSPFLSSKVPTTLDVGQCLRLKTSLYVPLFSKNAERQFMKKRPFLTVAHFPSSPPPNVISPPFPPILFHAIVFLVTLSSFF